MTKKFIIKHFEKCPICGCGKLMKMKKKSYYNGRLTVEYKCPEHRKIMIKSIKEFEIKEV